MQTIPVLGTHVKTIPVLGTHVKTIPVLGTHVQTIPVLGTHVYECFIIYSQVLADGRILNNISLLRKDNTGNMRLLVSCL